MNQTTPIRLKAADVNIVVSGGLRVIHAVGNEDDPASLIRIIEAIEYGWEHEDGSLFARYAHDFERTRCLDNHTHGAGSNGPQTDPVEPESDALQGLELSLSHIKTHVDGDYAWSVAEVDMQGTLSTNGKYLHEHGYETFLFHLVDGAWKVIHTHGSSLETGRAQIAPGIGLSSGTVRKRRTFRHKYRRKGYGMAHR